MAVRAARAAVDLAAFVAELSGTWHGEKFQARCPAHDDRTPSLSITVGRDGGLLLHCHAGCETAAVLAAMGKSFADLSPARRVVAEYRYQDFDDCSIILYTVVRYAPKDFRVMAPGLPVPEGRVLYSAPAIHYARDTGTPIYVVEGEKDANTLLQGADPHPATTCVGGAGKWLPHYSAMLAGCHVRIIADNDAPGIKHALQVAASLADHAASIEVLRAAVGCKDVTDHLAAGHTLDQLLPLEPPPTLTGVLVSDVTITPLDWAWAPYFPLGTLCFIDGDPGDGKSMLTIDLVARWSSGMAMPDGSPNVFGGPVGAIMIGAEDDPESTIAPRLRAAGCRPDKIKLITAGRTEDDIFTISTDLDALEAEIVALDARVVVIDPLPAFLADTTDSNRDASVRRALTPLAALARRLHVLILLVRHLNKGTGKAIYRGGGSIGFIGAARAAYIVSRNPDDENLRVLAVVKNNLAPVVPSLSYELVTDAQYNVARVEWHGSSTSNAQELLDGGPAIGMEGRADVQDYLRHLCAHDNYKWADILKYGREAGFSATSLEKHRHRVLTKHFISGEGNRGVTWGLHGGPRPLPATPLRLVPVAEQSTEDEDERDQQLAHAPLVCDMCGSTSVMRFAKPYWVVRCQAHIPYKN